MADDSVDQLQAQMTKNREDRLIDQSGLFAGILTYGNKHIGRFGGSTFLALRVIKQRDNDANHYADNPPPEPGKAHKGLGLMMFESPITGAPPFTRDGFTGLQDLMHWLAGHQLTDSEFPPESFPVDGKAEVEIQVFDESEKGNIVNKVWRNLNAGEINKEVTVIVDGEVVTA